MSRTYWQNEIIQFTNPNCFHCFQVFPNNIRATASGASGSSSYIFAFTINKLYYPMVDNMGLHGTLYFYSFISIGGCLFMYIMLPETEGRTLNDIEVHFADKTKTFDTNILKLEKMKRNSEKRGVDNFAMDKF